MTWKAMSAQRAADIVDFWLAAGWPQTPAQVQQLGEGIGWTPDDDEMMENGADGLSEPASYPFDAGSKSCAARSKGAWRFYTSRRIH